MYLCVLCGSQNKQPLFPYTTLNWLVFITQTECLLRGTDWLFKIEISLIFVFKWLCSTNFWIYNWNNVWNTGTKVSKNCIQNLIHVHGGLPHYKGQYFLFAQETESQPTNTATVTRFVTALCTPVMAVNQLLGLQSQQDLKFSYFLVRQFVQDRVHG